MRKISLIIGCFIVIVGGFMLFSSMIKDNDYKKEDEQALDNFFNNYNEVKEENKKDTSEDNIKIKNNYKAVIEVPSISLKTGVVMSDKLFSTMDRNVSIYPTSDMPDVNGGNFVLFAHSGNSRISYFKNIDKLTENDVIKIYYNKKEYKYKVFKKFQTDKKDDTPLYKMKDKTIITLFTCDKYDDNYRTVIVGVRE